MAHYVQRNFVGKIITLYASPAVQSDGFCLTDPEPLPDDHPEIIEFFTTHPGPPARQITAEEANSARKEYEKNKADTEQLQRLVLSLLHCWSSLELAMSGLLQAILNTKPPAMHVARAIYFSLGGFDARKNIVAGALNQFVEDHLSADAKKFGELKTLACAWGTIDAELSKARKKRNNVAHSSIAILRHGGKWQARLVAPVFDPIGVGNYLRKGTNPGMGTTDLEKAIALTNKVSQCVDRVHEAIAEFHEFGPQALPKKLARLTHNLQALHSL